MSRVTETLVLSPWSGGLNSAQDPIVLGLTPEGQNMLAQCDNVVFTTTGGRKKRGGQARLNSTQMNDGSSAASAVDGIYGTTFWFKGTASAKTEELVVFAESGRMYYSASFGSVLTNVSTTATSPTFSQGVISTEVMSEKLFIGHSTTFSPLVYTGGGTAPTYASASTAVVGTFPAAYLLRQHKNRMFLAGNDTYPDRLFYSAAENPYGYGTAGGYIDVYPGDGDPRGITAIFPSMNVNELFVAKRGSIFKIDTSDSSPNNWPVIRLTNGVGCVQHNSAVSVDQADIFFASDRGIHSVQQLLSQQAVKEGQFISAPIQTDYDDSANKNLISAVWAPDLNSYLFALQREGETFCETIFGFNIELGNWYRWTSTPCNFLFKRLNTSTEAFEYYACADSSSSTNRGYVNKLQQTNLWDFSSSTGNITTTIKTGLLYPQGNFLQERAWLNIILLVRSRDESPINVSYRIDEITGDSGVLTQQVNGSNLLGTSSGFLLGSTFILGAPFGAKPLFLHIGGVGNAIQITIMHDTIDADIEVYGLAVEYSSAGESQNPYRSLTS